MAVWSPTRTQQWLKCPRFWQLKCEGAEERRDKGWSPALIAGTAVHAGFAALMRGSSMTNAQALACDEIPKLWPADPGEWEQAMVAGKVERAVAKLVDTSVELLADLGMVTAVEEQLNGTVEDRQRGTYQGTPDLITMHGDVNGRYLAITDLKTHWTLDDVYVQRDQEDTRHSWQVYQYAWFAQEKYGTPVRAVRKVTVRLSPAPKVWTFTWPVRQEDLHQWARSAVYVWQQMGRGPVWENWTQCRNSFGRCGFYHICH